MGKQKTDSYIRLIDITFNCGQPSVPVSCCPGSLYNIDFNRTIASFILRYARVERRQNGRIDLFFSVRNSTQVIRRYVRLATRSTLIFRITSIGPITDVRLCAIVTYPSTAYIISYIALLQFDFFSFARPTTSLNPAMIIVFVPSKSIVKPILFSFLVVCAPQSRPPRVLPENRKLPRDRLATV